jgi:hypothetical protein
MLIMLKIGYDRYVLPSEKGVITVMNVLATARRVKEDNRYDGGGIILEDDTLKLKMEMLPNFKFTRSRKIETIEPEVIPPGELPPYASAKQIKAHVRALIGGGR